METVIGSVLACVLVFVALFFGWRQRRTMQTLRAEPFMADVERTYLAAQVRRRLVCSALLVVFAAFLVGWLFLQHRIGDLKPPEGQPVSEEAKEELWFLTFYWIAALSVLMAILVLATWDFIATARFGFARHKQLEQDRQAMLEDEAAKLRRRRTEMN